MVVTLESIFYMGLWDAMSMLGEDAIAAMCITISPFFSPIRAPKFYTLTAALALLTIALVLTMLLVRLANIQYRIKKHY